jgi:type IV secretory pathway VirJ component
MHNQGPSDFLIVVSRGIPVSVCSHNRGGMGSSSRARFRLEVSGMNWTILLFVILLTLYGLGGLVWSSPAGVSDLPLVELPASSDSPDLVVLLSGDGGWAGLVRDVGAVLNQEGLSVVGFDCLKYFWAQRTPEQTAADLERVLAHYLAAWNKTGVVLAGYSRGADVLPAVTSRLPEPLRRKIRLLALIGAATTVQFERSALGLLNLRSSGPVLPVMPDLEKLRGIRILCFYGSDERDTICSSMDPGLAECVELQGGHHFGGDFDAIGRRIAAELASDPRSRAGGRP